MKRMEAKGRKLIRELILSSEASGPSYEKSNSENEAFGVCKGEEIIVIGWIHRLRKLKSVTFLILRDRSGLLQCILTPEQTEQLNPTLESVVKLSGRCAPSKNDYGHVELVVESVEMVSQALPELPIQINGTALEVQLDTLLENRVLALRHPKEQAIFKIQAAIGDVFRDFLKSRDFTEIHTPKLVKEGAEGGSNVFKLDYFGETAYLAQSPQFYKQMMVIAGMERVFEVGSVFRAEAHSTSRHLNEYVSLDLEMGFIEHEDELMALETELLRFVFSQLGENFESELSLLEVTLPKVPLEIPKLKLEEAIEILKTQYGKTELEGDLDPEGEKLISHHMFKESGSEFLFLTHYPQRKRPMYTMPCGESETHSFDLIFRGVEITTGGRRIHQYQTLVDAMRKKGLDPSMYTSYLEAFKYGVPPHGGLAIGLERLTALLLGFSNIRRTSLFPRDGQRLVP
ncbi:aspartate--tRNA(Asn) ligase [Fusibacter bizertensis]